MEGSVRVCIPTHTHTEREREREREREIAETSGSVLPGLLG